MKKGIHPQWNKEVKVLVNGKPVMSVGSTVEEINVEIWSGTHPFFTGQETIVDLDSKIDTFNKKVALASKVERKSRREKRSSRKKNEIVSNSPLTLKDMLKQVS